MLLSLYLLYHPPQRLITQLWPPHWSGPGYSHQPHCGTENPEGNSGRGRYMISSSMARGLQRANILSNMILQKLANLRYLKKERENEKQAPYSKHTFTTLLWQETSDHVDLRSHRREVKEPSVPWNSSSVILVYHTLTEYAFHSCFLHWRQGA